MTTGQSDGTERGIDRRSYLKAIGAGSAIGLAGCVGLGGGGDVPDEITIGQPAALTGKWDFLQPAVSNATKMARQEINDAGGPLGSTLKVKRRDTQVKPQQAKQVVNTLLNNDDARAIVGLFSSEITPLWDFLQGKETPIVTPWPGTTFLDTKGGDKGTSEIDDDEWVWRTVIGDTVHTLGAAKYMLEQGYEKIGVMNGTSQGERSWADSFLSAYEKNGGTLAKRVEISEGKSSYSSSIDKLFDADFDAWALAVGLEDATTIVRDWADGDYGGQLLMEDGLQSSDLIDAVGDRASGAWIAAGSGHGPNYDAFESTFTKDYPDTDLHPWGIAAYDATNVVALAIHKAGSADPTEIEKAIGEIGREGGTAVSNFEEGMKALDEGDDIDYQGAGTPVDFTNHGNVFGSVSISEVTPDGFDEHDVVAADKLKGLIQKY